MNSLLKCCSYYYLTLTFSLFMHSGAESKSYIWRESNYTTITETEEIPLISYISFISQYTTKLNFAREAENWELADINNHEIEESSEHIITKAEVHDWIKISQLMKSMLLPQAEQVDQAIAGGNRDMMERCRPATKVTNPQIWCCGCDRTLL